MARHTVNTLLGKLRQTIFTIYDILMEILKDQSGAYLMPLYLAKLQSIFQDLSMFLTTSSLKRAAY